MLARLRRALPRDVVPSSRLKYMPDGGRVMVAGLVIRRQRPLAKAVFITLEDEHGHSPLILWPKVYERFRRETRAPLLLARGTVSSGRA